MKSCITKLDHLIYLCYKRSLIYFKIINSWGQINLFFHLHSLSPASNDFYDNHMINSAYPFFLAVYSLGAMVMREHDQTRV